MNPVRPRPRAAERGEVMPATVVFVTALVASTAILLSASEQWEARRSAAAAAATMARAAAQGDADLIRAGREGIDPDRARERGAQVVRVLAAESGADYEGRIVAIDGPFVTAEVSTAVDYTFPLPGFPTRISGSARAEAVRGGGQP